MKKTVFLLTSLALTQFAKAQNEYDALRFSQYDITGTARFTSMAGAFGALGGDLSGVAYNPAGLGRFSKGEGTFTLLFEDVSSTSTFKGNSFSNGKGNFNLGSLGIVGVAVTDSKDWRAYQFGITYNRTNYFHNRINFAGDHDNSLADVFRAEADGTAPGLLGDYFPNSANLAYNAYIIDPLDTTASTYTDRVPPWATVTQNRNILRTGYMGETAITFSADYMRKLYLGFSMGFPGLRYNEDWSHAELVNDTSTTLVGFTYSQQLNTRGLGFNFKGGLIFLPVEGIRVGLAFHSPSFLSMTDRWNNNLSSDLSTGEHYDESGPFSSYSYRLRTPGRIIGSLGFVIGSFLAIGAEAEYVNHDGARLRKDWADMTAYNFNNENDAIQRNFHSVLNLRGGIEVKLTPLYVRAGYAYYPSAYEDGLTSSNNARNVITGGLGMRFKKFFIDFALSHTTTNEDMYPYDPVLYNNQPAVINTALTRGTVTLGWRFMN